MRQRKRSPNYPREMISFALRLADEGMGQSAIEREIARTWPDDVPHLNTIKNWIAGRKERDGQRWSIAADPYTSSAEPGLVIPVLGALAAQGSAVRYFTLREAELLTRVREARPDWPEVRAWHMTRDLISADGDVERLEQLHLLLAVQDEHYPAAEQRGYFMGMVAGSAHMEPDFRASAGTAAMGAANTGVK